MNYDEEHDRLAAAFLRERKNADQYAAAHNRKLPSRQCPTCGDEGHVPGLMCPACGYRHPVAWAFVKDTEYGYDVVALGQSKRIYASFVVLDMG